MSNSSTKWDVVYKSAIEPDGSLLFPERLTWEFLNNARRVMGTYVYANQYLNQVIPDGDQTFKKEWIHYYSPEDISPNAYHFAAVDPAISKSDKADFTAIVVVAVDSNQRWYIKHASRHKVNPTELIDYLFRIQAQYKCQSIGIEDVAFQRSIIHFALEESRRRGVNLPITGVKHGPDKTKNMRILQLVPRFEWGTLSLNGGLHDFELELATFPRGTHDDLLDAASFLEEIVYYPQPIRRKNEQLSPNHPGYEAQYIRNLQKGQRTNEGSF